MPVVNTLSYCDLATFDVVKSFIVQESVVEQKSKKHHFVLTKFIFMTNKTLQLTSSNAIPQLEHSNGLAASCRRS